MALPCDFIFSIFYMSRNRHFNQVAWILQAGESWRQQNIRVFEIPKAVKVSCHRFNCSLSKASKEAQVTFWKTAEKRLKARERPQCTEQGFFCNKTQVVSSSKHTRCVTYSVKSPKQRVLSSPCHVSKQTSKQPHQKQAENLNRHCSKEDIQWPRGTWKDAQHHSLSEKCKSKL